MARENKIKAGKVKKMTIRIPTYQYEWLKSRSGNTKGTDAFESMGSIISQAINEFMTS